MYSTSSVLRTIELILGLPPMTQYDAAAMPMWRCFTANPDFSVYHCLPSNINLNDKNTKQTEAARLSETFDFSGEDKIPEVMFNEALWLGLKDKHAPAPKRAAFVRTND